MAQVYTQTVTISFSKLVKNSASEAALIPEDFTATLEAVVAEIIADPAVVVEVTTE